MTNATKRRGASKSSRPRLATPSTSRSSNTPRPGRKKKPAREKLPPNPKGRGQGQINPRVAARRKHIALRTRRRRTWAVFALTVVTTLAVVAIAAANSTLLDVETITVEGASASNEGQIIRASGVVPGEPLVDVDVDASAARIAAVPWVDTSQVTKSWSGHIKINVTERVGFTTLASGNRFVLVDRSGRQLEVMSTHPPDQLPIVGVEASGVPGQSIGDDALAAFDLVEVLPAHLHDMVSAIVVDGSELSLELIDGGRIDLGDNRSLSEKLVAADTVLTRVDLACLAVIDVAVPSSPTLQRATGSNRWQETGSRKDGC